MYFPESDLSLHIFFDLPFEIEDAESLVEFALIDQVVIVVALHEIIVCEALSPVVSGFHQVVESSFDVDEVRKNDVALAEVCAVIHVVVGDASFGCLEWPVELLVHSLDLGNQLLHLLLFLDLLPPDLVAGSVIAASLLSTPSANCWSLLLPDDRQLTL